MQLIRPSEHDMGRAQQRPHRYDLHAMEQQQVSDGAMTYADLEALLRDVENEPPWRGMADKCAAYYDGYQKTAEQRRLEAEGQPVAVVNLISRTVNTLLGNEIRGRTNWKLSADSDQEFGEVADAMQVKLTQAQRETNADMAISEAYGGQTKAAMGWVEVSRVANPFEPFPYRVAPVHRNEMWWDWRAKELDLNDARWLMRKQWHDLDDLEALMPEWADLFRYYGGTVWRDLTFTAALRATDMQRMADNERRAFRVDPDEWLDTGRRRIVTYEVWYRVYRQAVAILLPDGTTKEFNPRNPLHQAAMQRGIGKLMRAPKRVLRMALFVGPHRIMDVATDRRRFPYIPFWAFRDDEDRSPYAMTAGMLYPQDEYNARRSRLMWLLQAAQVFVEDDALSLKYNDLTQLAREVMRPDAMVVLNAGRRNAGQPGVRVERNTQLPAEQANVMTDAKNLIMEQPGVSATMMGDKVPGVSSGLAFNSLVNQSNIAIGDHDDNYRYGRRLVGEALLDLILEDHRRPDMQVPVGTGETQRVVVLNSWDPQSQMPVNHVEGAALKVALDDVPNTPAYKMQQQQQIGTVLQVAGQDPAVRAVMVPAFIESTDLPNRHSDARWLRQQYGVPQPGDREGQRAADAQRAQAQQQQQQLQAAAVQADLADKQASAEQKASAAELNRARVAEVIARLNDPAANDQAISEALAEADGQQDQRTG